MTTANFIFSLFLFFGLFSFAGAALLLIQFRRDRICYVTYWVIGAFSISIGVVGIALSPVLPEWMSYKLANGFTFAAAILFNYSLSCLSGKNTPPIWVAFNSVAMAILLIGGLFFVSDHFGPRYQPALVAVVTAITSYYGFILIYKYYQQSKIYLAAVLSATYLIGALVWSIRAVMVLYFDIGFAHEGGSSNAISFVALLLLGILRFMIFAGLVMAIADRDRGQLIAELHEQRINVANQNTANSEEKLRHVLNATGEGIWDWNILTGEVRHNIHWLEMLGEDPAKTYFSVEDFKSRIHPKDLHLVTDGLNATLTLNKDYRLKYRMIREDDIVIWVEDKGAIVERSEKGEPLRMVGAISDITSEKASQEKIQELIFFDSLTKLPNRQYIQDRIVRTINESIRNKTHSGLMYLDLDNFKNINDTYGHNVGDVLLKAFGARIQNAIRPKDVVARIGGDEYLILFEEIGATVEEAKAVLEDAIERVLGTFSEHFDLGGGIYVHTKASIGVVIFGHELNQIDDILKFADLAMYAAKEDLHNSHRFFDLDLMTQFNQKNEYLLQLRDACKQKQLFTVYHPSLIAIKRW
jgi:diguanylate cyclase (GGDEF)-like protein